MADGRKPYDLTGAAHDYPEREGPPRRTLLIATHPRSGSSLLGEALYFAGGLGCPLEYFHRGFLPGLAGRWGTHGLREQIAAVHRHRTDPSGTLSVKIFWRDVEDLAAELDPARFGELRGRAPDAVTPDDYRAIAAVLAQAFPNPEHVHLERIDRVRQAVSGLAATQTGQFRIVPDMGEQPAIGTAAYDFDRIDGYVAYSDFCHGHWRNYFAATGTAPLALTYEQLAADYEGSVRTVLGHFGSAAAVPPMRMRRQADAGNEAWVLRYLRERTERA
ncbi:Stf0 family sulfotransferase [Sphingomonas sp. LB-2]|uniref:Stf0 family sulfotransferase n=1 Tax=Sphingomonas caeni TaxID=2984949 RepID=UPI002231044C|nr:Stf0 family sulfotransferase [Sphingomonas caeni]MCW3848245.1 Stf0 family sulfotransferase [Sphingomonas caeni]